jgi:hypothetical protein
MIMKTKIKTTMTILAMLLASTAYAYSSADNLPKNYSITPESRVPGGSSDPKRYEIPAMSKADKAAYESFRDKGGFNSSAVNSWVENYNKYYDMAEDYYFLQTQKYGIDPKTAYKNSMRLLEDKPNTSLDFLENELIRTKENQVKSTQEAFTRAQAPVATTTQPTSTTAPRPTNVTSIPSARTTANTPAQNAPLKQSQEFSGQSDQSTNKFLSCDKHPAGYSVCNFQGQQANNQQRNNQKNNGYKNEQLQDSSAPVMRSGQVPVDQLINQSNYQMYLPTLNYRQY